MIERVCGACGKAKVRVKAEKIPKKRGHYYRDDEGRRWHGRRCPACHSGSVRKRYYGEEAAPLSPPVFSRFCRKCSKPLPQDRYFKHKSCDYAHAAYFSNGNIESIWTPDYWGCGTVNGVSF